MRLAVITILLSLPATVTAQHQHETLGTVNFRNSGVAAAQPALQRGVALLHSFEYGEAAESFRHAQRADPTLAVAYWLEALTYSHVLWAEEDLSASRAALARLAATPQARLNQAKTERERAFGAAVEAFYVDAALPVRARAFADSMHQLALRDSTDQEAAAFAAIASMIAWYAIPAAERMPYQDRVQEHAHRVFRANAQHPGATHYLIHFVDMQPAVAPQSLQFARAYDKIAPDAEHALHMPSHVYLPLGLWEDVVAANERAWAAARKEVVARQLAAADNSWHSLEWLQYGYLQLGRHEGARALIDTASQILQDADIAEDNPDARNVVNFLAFRYGMETGQWDVYPKGIPTIDEVMRQPRPNPRAWGMATTAAYQAAVAALRARGDHGPAQAVASSFRASADSLPANAPRRSTLNRLATQLEAMLAYAGGNRERAIALLRELAPAEPANASLPPTTIPSYELLGEYLLAAQRHEEAAAAFEKALATRAHRALARRGLERARAHQNN